MKMRRMVAEVLLWTSLLCFAPAAQAQAPTWLPGAEQWQPYLQRSPADWSQMAQDPWSVLQKLMFDDLQETFRQTIRDYTEVLLFLTLAAVLGLEIPGADGHPVRELLK